MIDLAALVALVAISCVVLVAVVAVVLPADIHKGKFLSNHFQRIQALDIAVECSRLLTIMKYNF